MRLPGFFLECCVQCVWQGAVRLRLEGGWRAQPSLLRLLCPDP